MLIQKTSPSHVIKAWQTFLNQQGFTIVGQPDGIWGPHTSEGSKEFQQANGLTADGLVGIGTIAAAAKKGFEIPTPQPFDPPGHSNTIFDISHLNAKVDLAKAKAAGMLAVFHKATQYVTFRDKDYPIRRTAAKEAGLLWGAYHFGAGGDGAAQADYFLEWAKPDGQTLLVLDFEPDTIKGQTTMTLPEARDFINQVKEKTGKVPVLYAGSYLKGLFRNSTPDPVLTQCPLWLAQYGSVTHLPNGWDNYTFWQYTDGVHGPGPLPVDGVGHCDRDLFRGTAEELAVFWKEHAV